MITTTEDTKICSNCQCLLALSEFPKSRSGPKGRHSHCTQCRVRVSRERYKHHKSAKLCVSCSNPLGEGGSTTLCEKCLPVHLERMKKWRRKNEI